MQHSIDWHDDAINAVSAERATVGDLRLVLNNQNVTKHILNDTLVDHVTVALYGLADGLVHDWWTIFGARDREISLQKYRTGYLIPDIRLQFDGAAFQVSARQSVYTDPDLRFWGGTTEIMDRTQAEIWLSEFIGEVIARLESKGLHETSAALRWRRVQSSRRSSEREFCEAAGSLGLDPYQIEDKVAQFIERAEIQFGDEALVEFVSGSGDVDHSRLIDWVDRMARYKGFGYRLADLRPLVDEITSNIPSHEGTQPWAAGYRRARAMRGALCLKQNERAMSFFDLARRFGAHKNYGLAPRVDGINALRRETPNGIDVHVRNHGHDAAETAHRFALARAIGDAACFPEPQTAPINRLRNAYRQAAGRAFAAEFLAPIDEIRSMQEDERDVYTISEEFGVSPAVIEHQIENTHRIDQACA